jgi:CPA1 family monovalent cation:H+ antiporter/cell volume regulation protein A
VFGALLLVAVLLDDMAARIRVPGILLVLVLGLLTDNRLDALPGQVPPLLSLSHADQIAQMALVLVLFFGGLTTNWRELRPVLQPALRLATLGSLLTALLLTLLVLALGRVPLPVFAIPLSLPLALFVGAMVCSTDASAVIALLRPLNNHLPRRLIDLIETESAFNDPVAVVLLLVGATQLLGGSGLLAAYIAGLVLGNAGDCDRPLLVDAHAGFAKIAELMLFLCMGLVVQPEDVVREVVWAVLLFAAMLLVRWLMVQLLLVNSGFERPEKLLVACAGLRGAVPIALAIQAAASPIPWGRAMPPLALGVVQLGLGLQGLALVPMARRLGLSERA